MRADAVRNRAAIVEAAGAVLARHGNTADVREIARLSGVGMGTLYRHFPTKDDLLATVLHQEFQAWAGSAQETATAAADPWTALTDVFEQALSVRARHRAVMQCYADNWSEPTADCSVLLRPVLEELLARAQAAGLVRDGVTGEDLTLLLATLGQAVQLTEPDRPAAWRRLLTVCLDGLRAGHSDPLPTVTPAPTDATVPGSTPAPC
jgi:AcrR family transcriptional regulator